MNHRFESSAGFTVIELLVAMALLLVALTMFGGALVVSERSASRQLDQGQTLNALRASLASLDADLRSGFVASSSSPTALHVYTERNGAPECVGWRLVTASGVQRLERASWPPGSPAVAQWIVVARGIRNQSLGYAPFAVQTISVLTSSGTVPVGVMAGVDLFISADSRRVVSVNEVTRVTTTIMARNATLATSLLPSGRVIALAC